MNSLQILQQILIHTPPFVWGILVICVVMGVLQSRDQLLGRSRLIVPSVIWTAFGLWGVSSAFGLQRDPLLAWALALLLVVATLRGLDWPAGVRFSAGDQRFLVPGSWLPMVMIMAIFMAKYLVGVSLGMTPALARVPEFALGVSALYGALSGLFIARSRHILRSAPAPAQRLTLA